MRFALLAIFAVVAAALPTAEQDVAARASVDACPGCDPRSVAPAPMVAEHLNTTLELVQAHAPAEGAPKAEAQMHEMEIEEKTTKSGKKYRVHRPKGSAVAEAKARKLGKRGAHFLLPMYWKAGRSGQTDGNFESVSGIDQWNIDNFGIFWKYRLNFHTAWWYNYWFEDESGDWYNCNVYLSGQHYIDYNSKKPNMIMAQGA